MILKGSRVVTGLTFPGVILRETDLVAMKMDTFGSWDESTMYLMFRGIVLGLRKVRDCQSCGSGWSIGIPTA
jgi:hypothetical protein